MDYEPYPQYSHVDQDLVDKIVCKLKSQGIFDKFRKDCLADVDTKPAYQNLQQRVNGTVANFLANHKWRHDLNKNQLRENLRRHVQQDFLEVGVSRIVEQVVNPKICPVFLPRVEDVVYDCLGIEKPKPKKPPQGLHLSQSRLPPVKRSCSPLSLLPHDLDPVSPESDHHLDDDSLHGDNGNKEESRNSLLAGNISNDDSHLSGISELTSHGSIKDVSEVACMSEKSNILADRTNHEIPNSSPSHKNLSGCENIGSDFDNFSNLQEKLKKTDHLNGNIVKKETGVFETSGHNIEDIHTIKDEPIENSENKPMSFHLDNSVSKPDKEDTVYDTYEQRSSSSIPPNFKMEDIKVEGKLIESPSKNNGLTFHNETHSFHNETSSDVICKSERPDDSLSNISKYSEESRSSDSVVKDKSSRNKHSDLKHNSSKRVHKKSETSEKHRKEDGNKHYKFEGRTKHKNETDSEYNSSDKDQKSDHNSSDKESSKKHIDNKNTYSTTEFKNIDIEVTKENLVSAGSNNKDIKSIECNSRNDSSGKSERKSSSSSHRSSSRDKKHDSSREHKSREHRHDREKDGSKHRSSSDKRDESKDKKYKDKSQEIKRHDSREERDKQKSKKDKTDEKESKNNNSSEVSSNKTKENKPKDEPNKHVSDKERHKSNKDESRDKKEKSHDKKDHYRHKEEGDKKDKEKYKDEKYRDDKQRNSRDHKSRHERTVETKKTTESKLDEKRVSEDKTHHKRNSNNSDLLKRSSSSSEKIGDRSEKEDRVKEKDRNSKKRKGERCKEEVKHKEARRSTDRDSNGRGSSGIIDKGTQQSQKDNQYISSNNTQSFESSANDRNSCSDSVEVLVNSESEISIAKSENSFSDDQHDANDIDLILQKINSSIQEVQGDGEGCDEPDSSDVGHTDTQCEDPNSETNSVAGIKKPKIAKNIFEIRKIMQARKNIDKKRRKDIIKRGFMRKLARDNIESQEFSKPVSGHSESDRSSVKVTTKNQSLNTAFVNENVDSNNFVEKREYGIVLKNDVETNCLDTSSKEEESSDDELFKGFSEIDVSMAMQNLSKAICYRTQTLVKLSPLKLDEEFFYNGKLLRATVDFPTAKKIETSISSKRKKNIKGVLLDNNLNKVNTRAVCGESVSNSFGVSVTSQHSVSFDDKGTKRNESYDGENDSIKVNSDLKSNYISSHMHSNDSTEGNDNSDDQKTKNGCFVVVHLTDVLETDKLQSSPDESCSSNLPVIISPDHCYDSDVNYDENYGLNESFSSDFGGSKPLSVSLTETMLENLMKESNLISDYKKNEDISSSDEGWNGYAKISSVQNDSSQLTVNISESSSYLSGQSPHETDASTAAKRKETTFDAPEPKKSR